MHWIRATLWMAVFVALLAPCARADEAGTSHVVRRGYSGPVTAPSVPSGRVYYRAGEVPQGPPIEEDWRVFLGLYMWGSSISGNAYDDGVDTDIDVPFEDLFQKLRYAFQGYLEVGWRRWSLGLDSTFIGLGKGLPSRDGFYPSFELDQTTIDFRLGYTVYCRHLGNDAWGCCLYPRRLTLDAIAGTRYWNLKQKLEVVSGGNPTVSREGRETWWDPYVGARLRYPFAKRWGFNLYGDVGGFGVGSDLTWQVQSGIYYRITRQLRVALMYRALYVDRVDGTGGGRDGVKVTYHGPLLGIGFDF